MSGTYEGVDLSFWQSSLTNGAVLANGGIDFAILKMTEGRTIKDSAFSSHYNMCKRKGIPVGAYVYSHAVGASGGKAEADFALQTLNGRALELPVYLDIESEAILSSGKEAIMAATRAFGAAMRAAGYKVGVYASRSRYGPYIDADALRNEGYSIWCAAYNNTGAGMTCDIWQYTDTGRLSGYNGNLDMNILYNPALLREVKPIEKPEERYWPPRTLDLGMSGPDVVVCQAVLNARGYKCAVDGKFGQESREAAISFQKSKKLTADGIPGDETWPKLLELKT